MKATLFAVGCMPLLGSAARVKTSILFGSLFIPITHLTVCLLRQRLGNAPIFSQDCYLINADDAELVPRGIQVAESSSGSEHSQGCKPDGLAEGIFVSASGDTPLVGRIELLEIEPNQPGRLAVQTIEFGDFIARTKESVCPNKFPLITLRLTEKGL
jgi:hypothetical protein